MSFRLGLFPACGSLSRAIAFGRKRCFLPKREAMHRISRLVITCLILGACAASLCLIAQSRDLSPVSSAGAEEREEFDRLADESSRLMELRDFPAAIPLLERMRGLRPKDIGAAERLGIAIAYTASNMIAMDRAFASLKDAERYFSRNPGIYFCLSMILSMRGDIGGSIDYLNEAMYYGYADIEFVKAIPAFSALRNSEWWGNLEPRLRQIGEILAEFQNTAKNEKDLPVTQRIRKYSALKEGFLHSFALGSLVQCLPILALGYAHMANGQYAIASAYWQAAESIQRTSLGPEHPDLALAINNEGQCFLGLGEYDRAIERDERALAIQLKTLGPEHTDVAATYHNLAVVFEEEGDFDKASGYVEKSLSIYENAYGSENAAVATAYNTLGSVLASRGNPDGAIVQFDHALAIRMQIFGEDHPDTATSLNNIGACFARKGDYRRAIEYYEKARVIRDRVLPPQHPDIAICLDNLGVAYGAIGDAAKQFAYCEKALAQRISYLGATHPLVATSYRNLGILCIENGSFKDAIRYMSSSLGIWSHSAAYSEAIEGAWEFGKAWMANSDLSHARQALAIGIDAVERSRIGLGSARISIMARSLPLYYASVDVDARSGFPSEAFGYAESLRSRGFLDKVGMEAALKLEGVTEADRDRVRGLSARIEGGRDELERLNGANAEGRDSPAIINASSELEAAEKELRDLDEAISKRIPKYAALRNPKPIDLKAAKGWCGVDRVVLEYVLWDPELEKAMKNTIAINDAALVAEAEANAAKLTSYCIVVSSNGAQCVELDGAFDYAASVEDFRAAIAEGRGGAALEGLRNLLYKKLVAPVEACLPAGAKRLLVVPDGPLAFLPFDLLRPDATTTELGLRYAISLSPSASVSMARQAAKANDKPIALALGGSLYATPDGASSRGGEEALLADSEALAASMNPTQLAYYIKEAKEEGAAAYYAGRGFRWSDLPGTLTEVKRLGAEVFIDASPKLLTGAEASEANLKALSKSGELKGYDFVHLACHGYFDSLVPELSSVVLSEVSGTATAGGEDGYLTVPEAALLDLDARMVSLSACETGLGQTKRGDGMVGLARAFLTAGARAVGVSLWSVDDEATAEFMVRLYRKVAKEGMTFPDAYRSVKAEFRADRRWSAPRYWAAFQIYE
jgi:CHAT domain-containing protein